MSLQSEALRYWRMGQYDTAHIAEILNVTEATVYNTLSKAKLRQRKTKSPTEVRRQYRLRQGNVYLDRSAEFVTSALSDAWAGDAEDALTICATSPLASNMLMELVA